MLGARGVILLPFVVFAHVNEAELLAGVEFPFDLGDRDFADPRSGVLAEFFKSLRMFHCCSFLEYWDAGSAPRWTKRRPARTSDCLRARYCANLVFKRRIRMNNQAARIIFAVTLSSSPTLVVAQSN